MEKEFFDNVFDGAFNLVADLDYDSMRIEVEKILHVEEGDDNIWNANIEFTIFANKDGIGFHHRIPGGYSEYTYDPDDTRNFYRLKNFDAFVSLALTQDQREFLTQRKRNKVLKALEELWGTDVET